MVKLYKLIPPFSSLKKKKILTCWPDEVREDGRSGLSVVLVGEEVGRDARVRVVLDLPHGLAVGRVLALARDPHHVAHLRVRG